MQAGRHGAAWERPSPADGVRQACCLFYLPWTQQSDQGSLPIRQGVKRPTLWALPCKCPPLLYLDFFIHTRPFLLLTLRPLKPAPASRLSGRSAPSPSKRICKVPAKKMSISLHAKNANRVQMYALSWHKESVPGLYNNSRGRLQQSGLNLMR